MTILSPIFSTWLQGGGHLTHLTTLRSLNFALSLITCFPPHRVINYGIINRPKYFWRFVTLNLFFSQILIYHHALFFHLTKWKFVFTFRFWFNLLTLHPLFINFIWHCSNTTMNYLHSIRYVCLLIVAFAWFLYNRW